MAYDALHARPTDIVVAGGMESMTNAPYLLPKMRGGARLGHAEVKDHMFLDGLEDAYDKGRLMGTFAEDTRTALPVHARGAGRVRHREPQARQGGQRGRLVRQGDRAGHRARAVPAPSRSTQDEQPFTADPAKIPKLKPAFREGGTVTAANSSSISDGAAALVLMRASEAKRRKLHAAGTDQRRRQRRAGAGLVHHGAGRRHARSCWSRSAGAPGTSASTRSTRPSRS